MALHLKNTAYNHFSRLTWKITALDSENQCYDVIVIQDLDYANIPVTNSYGDVIVPTVDISRKVKSITLVFSNYHKNSVFWGTSQTGEHFRLALEGRFNRHYDKQLLHSSSGGVISAPMTVNGKNFLFGEQIFNAFSELPTNAAPGAIATVGTQPVSFSCGKWWFSNLVGNTTFLSTGIFSLLGNGGQLNVGQRAYLNDGTTKKPLWWNGSAWIDATGTVIINRNS